MQTEYDAFGLTDIGPSREKNEDVYLSLPEHNFFAIADGMGGHLAGEVAAKEAIDSLARSILSIQTKDTLEIIIELRYAIEKANRRILKKGRTSESHTGMGTTLCCLLWIENTIVYAHVGDSRLYRFRNQTLELLTEDHSLFAKWLATGKLAEECKTPYPYKNVITRAVGTGERANPEIAFSEALPEDIYILSTDGLTDVLEHAEIEKILKTTPNFSDASKKLIEEAKFKGSSDNMTVLIIKRRENGENLSRQQLNDGARQRSLPSDASRP